MEENQIANVCRNGAFGDVVYCSAITSQLKKLGYQVIFYTSCEPIAKLLDGVDLVLNISHWNNRPAGRDISVLAYPFKDGYPAVPMMKHLIEYACIEAGLPVGESKLKSFDPITNGDYATFQPNCGWSTYKEYDYWQPILCQLSKTMPIVTIDASRSWSETCALIQHARIHLGGDSVGNHIAGAYKTPAVILFGSTSPAGSGYKSAINLWKPHCWINGFVAPCYYEDKFSNGIKLRNCGDKCINGIEQDDIRRAIDQMLVRLKTPTIDMAAVEAELETCPYST